MKTVFVSDEFEKKATNNEIVCCGTYHPYIKNGTRNPEFDLYSGRILDLKESSCTIFITRYSLTETERFTITPLRQR